MRLFFLVLCNKVKILFDLRYELKSDVVNEFLILLLDQIEIETSDEFQKLRKNQLIIDFPKHWHNIHHSFVLFAFGFEN